MTFYALRVECPSCRHAFLVGGGRGHDLLRWRQCEVECPNCRRKASTETARPESLSRAPFLDVLALPLARPSQAES